MKIPTLIMSLIATPLLYGQNTEVEVSIYPNPVSDVIKINKAPDINVERISVFNLTGEIVLLAKTDEFNISKLNTGYYTAKIETDHGISFKKLIVN